jgi:CrcB protein
MLLSIFAVAIGGALGSLLRWVLGFQFNALYPNLPLGTLLANLIAGYAKSAPTCLARSRLRRWAS